MKRLKLIGIAVLGILAVTAVAMTSTSMALEVLPTPTAKAPVSFTVSGKEGSLTTLKGGIAVICTSHTGKGEFTSTTLGTIEIKFKGCKAAGILGCTGLSGEAKEEIIFKGEVHFTDGLLSEKQVSAGAVLTTSVIHFTCGTILVEVLSGGCSAGLVLANSLDKLVSSVFIDFLLKGGVEGDTDIPFINLPTESACELKVRTNEATEEDMGAIKQEEAELTGFKQNGAAVTVLLHTK